MRVISLYTCQSIRADLCMLIVQNPNCFYCLRVRMKKDSFLERVIDYVFVMYNAKRGNAVRREKRKKERSEGDKRDRTWMLDLFVACISTDNDSVISFIRFKSELFLGLNAFFLQLFDFTSKDSGSING